MNVVWVFLGGGLGAVSRWGLALVVVQPWATVAVNLIGSFALAMLMHPAVKADDTLRIALGAGFLGSFTTYSTFNLFLVTAVKDGDYGGAALQIGVTVIGALACGFAGWSAGAALGSGS